MSITVSENRAKHEMKLHISDKITVTATGTVMMNIPLIVKNIDFFPSSFKVNIGDFVICIDPVCVENPIKADLILVTHHHQDHFLIDDIKKLMKEDTLIMGPKKVYKKLKRKLQPHHILLVKPHEKNQLENVEIETLPSYNIKKGMITPHPSKHENVGYLIRSKEFSLYHTGDTDVLEEMKAIKDLSVLIAPIDGDNLTMATLDVVDLANLIKPVYVIPAHYELKTDALITLKHQLDSKLIILDGNHE
ncbi:MAG: MBL fold metallo-hydrolase [Clostridia bacterium]|nr:MBL fold metallo-hydrolase [Clostridia bacterium]